MFPVGNGVEETQMCVSLYTPEPGLTESAERQWDNNLDLLIATVKNQDFPVSEDIHAGFISVPRTQSYSDATNPHCSIIIKQSKLRWRVARCDQPARRQGRSLGLRRPRIDHLNSDPAAQWGILSFRGADCARRRLMNRGARQAAGAES